MPITRRDIGTTTTVRTEPTGRTPDTETRLAQLEARVAQLEKALKVGSNGEVTLSGMTVSIEATVALALKSSTMTLTSTGPMTLKGSLIRIN